MIRTAIQLKAKVRNLSGGDRKKAQTLIRNFIMERFLERITRSQYRNNFILKGGMLVAAIVGLDTRATMDIDTTVKSLNLTKDNAVNIVEDIIAIDLSDGVQFQITKVTDIMEERDYPGIRFMLETTMDKMRQAIKIDISTGDIITPGAVEYAYNLMFEDRAIFLWTYNMETLLTEKLETIMARGTANTRMRDFYDIHVISHQETFDRNILKKAFLATSAKRNTIDQIPDFRTILSTVEADDSMRKQWESFREDSFFVGELSWNEVMASVKVLAEDVL
ncbi:nucleotidyl transferase AbiEii/AbiGii toxin family protein [Stomatobaculum longum]|uniref:nucleotidyl transferase AbiEii/AbiGii toxin family protein n=1 Tax=Stomatobaculum longum TaxID=796942 RepID=UPI0028039C7F|nr:nucleotidyl transferase AbiEii/AbiGii toxin family protein [Stomatobaculum longum]